MFTWAEIVLLVLRIAQGLMNYVSSSQQIKAGTDAEIARTSAAILMKTASAKAVMEEMNALRGSDLDVLLRGLEPGADGQLLSGVPKDNSGKG